MYRLSAMLRLVIMSLTIAASLFSRPYRVLNLPLYTGQDATGVLSMNVHFWQMLQKLIGML